MRQVLCYDNSQAHYTPEVRYWVFTNTYLTYFRPTDLCLVGHNWAAGGLLNSPYLLVTLKAHLEVILDYSQMFDGHRAAVSIVKLLLRDKKAYIIIYIVNFIEFPNETQYKNQCLKLNLIIF